MKTVYDLYHWSYPDAAAEVTRGQAGLDKLDEPDARAKVTYWRDGQQVTS